MMIIARRTESVNESVINAAVNCCHMRPVNLTLITLLTLRCLQLNFYFYYAACLSRTGDTIYFPDQLKYNCNAFMLQYRLNSTFQNANIDDPRKYIGFYKR